MAGFAPSPAAAARALGSKNKIEHRVHPGGAAGVKFSLEECAKRVKEGRNDPRLKGWAGQVLIAAGKPQGEAAQVQALLEAFRKRTMYVPDPTQTEMVASPHVTLCLDEHGLCMPAGDCDDRVVALAGAALSMGIDVRIVGQAFDREAVASHVIFKFKDARRGWLKVDPSHDSWPVGHAAMATREWELDPMAMNVGLAGIGSEKGDFVGIGRLPPSGNGQPQGLGTPPTYVLGQNTIPLNAPVGSKVQEQPGSPYTTTCTKQADNTWSCTNGSVFQPGQLENLASVSCPPGATFVPPGLCVPPGGRTLSDGTVLMPDGSYHMKDGSVLLANGTFIEPNGTTVAPNGQVTLSTSAEISNALAAAQQAVMHPLNTAALGASAIGQGAGQILSSTVSGFGQGLVSPSGGAKALEALTWIASVAALAGAAYLLAPIIKVGAQEWAARRTNLTPTEPRAPERVRTRANPRSHRLR